MYKTIVTIMSTTTAANRILAHRAISAVFRSIRCKASAESAGGVYCCAVPKDDSPLMGSRSQVQPKAFQVPRPGRPTATEAVLRACNVRPQVYDGAASP